MCMAALALPMHHQIVISLGSNIGHRLHHLQQAVMHLQQSCLTHIRCSMALETDAIVPPNAPFKWHKPFLNMVVVGVILFNPKPFIKRPKRY
jgi:2-amino-4-hydroxy-6-hydroxymethyldihydropteridine diphosphokinase / dihydropteroate synthase